MENTHDTLVFQITAHFVAEKEAGRTPRLTDYLQRYPQYANDIVDFVAYYFAAEADLPATTESIPALSPETRSTLNHLWERGYTLTNSEKLSLIALAQQQHYSLQGLAVELDLSTDILEKLADGQLAVNTIPQELPGRLARILTQSLSTIRLALGMVEPVSRTMIAEPSALYELSSHEAIQQSPQSFRQAISTSPELTLTQRTLWLTILKYESL